MFLNKVIGVDLTDKMLAMARQRVAKNNWTNIELVQMDATQYSFPDNINGIISTFAITLIPGFEEIISRGARALAPKGRLVIADLRKPDRWPLPVVKIMVWLTRPFGTSLEIASRKPWEAVERHLADTGIIKLYGGFTYISWGEKL